LREFLHLAENTDKTAATKLRHIHESETNRFSWNKWYFFIGKKTHSRNTTQTGQQQTVMCNV